MPKEYKRRRTPSQVYAQVLQIAREQAALGVFYPQIRSLLENTHHVHYARSKELFEVGLPHLGLQPINDVLTLPQELVVVNERPTDIVATRLNAALIYGPKGKNVLETIIANALDNASPNQAVAWKLMLQYGLGMPKKNLDDAAIELRAVQLMEARLEQLKNQQLADVESTPTTDVIDVTAEEGTKKGGVM